MIHCCEFLSFHKQRICFSFEETAMKATSLSMAYRSPEPRRVFVIGGTGTVGRVTVRPSGVRMRYRDGLQADQR